jgi:hypothetical protein
LGERDQRASSLMDWATSSHRAAPRPDPPAPELVERCWQMRSLQKATRHLTCGVYRLSDGGFEVRVAYSELELLRSQRVPNVDAGRDLAERWHQVVIAKGGFVDTNST